jgi:hypothetical protein
MAIISDKFKLIFIMNPRTGCTVMGNLLRNKLGGYYVPEEDIINDKNQIMIQKNILQFLN